MMVIRPVEPGDLPGLLKLAAETGGGLTSLPVDEVTLAARIARSQQTWRGELPTVSYTHLTLPTTSRV